MGSVKSEDLFPKLEVWPEPVDGGELLTELVEAFGQYVVLPAAAAEALALWTVHAHCHDAADISPILAITSPTPRCGKTTLLMLLQHLTPKPLPTANVTAAALFRSIELWRPTVLIDEADTFLRDNDELRGVLNSGHCRATAYVIRTCGEDHEPRRFATWAPKAIALIGDLPSTVADRSIEISLQRKQPDDRVQRFRLTRTGHLRVLCRKAARWTHEHLENLRDADPDMPADLHDRAADSWRALIAIADHVGGCWPSRARTAAVALSGNDVTDETSIGLMLLADIRQIFDEQGVDDQLETGKAVKRISSTVLASALAELEGRPWPEWRGKPITANVVARLLRPFKITPKQIRIGACSLKGYEEDWFADAFARYIPKQSETPKHDSDFNMLADMQIETAKSGVSAREDEIVSEINVVSDVSVETERGVNPDLDHCLWTAKL